jgi:hypothetical protein
MTGRTKDPKALRAALGVRCHSGWAAYVILRGSTTKPEIVARGRLELCDASIEGSKQPFHHAEPMAFAAAERFIARCRASSSALASRALQSLEREHGSLCGCCVLTASGRKLPQLAEILASHAMIHAAEGEFFRDAAADAAERSKIPVIRIRERELDDVSGRLPGTAVERRIRLEAFGKQVGTPWRQDEKFAAIGAWLALAAKPALGSQKG